MHFEGMGGNDMSEKKPRCKAGYHKWSKVAKEEFVDGNVCLAVVCEECGKVKAVKPT
jgi:hypothetical protein